MKGPATPEGDTPAVKALAKQLLLSKGEIAGLLTARRILNGYGA
jgi:hypothetical protein